MKSVDCLFLILLNLSQVGGLRKQQPGLSVVTRSLRPSHHIIHCPNQDIFSRIEWGGGKKLKSHIFKHLSIDWRFTFIFVYLQNNVFRFIYLVALGALHAAFSSCGEWGLGFLAVPASHYRGFSHCRAQPLERRLDSCGRWALLLHGTWDLPGSWTEPSSPALAGGVFTTEPPGKSSAK